MSHDFFTTTTALAGVYQAVDAVIQIAQVGNFDAAAVEPSLYSLFQIETPTADAVFGAPGAVLIGAQKLVAQLTGAAEHNLELTRCVIQVMRLESNLARSDKQLERLSIGVAAAVPLREEFGLIHTTLFAHFAELYQETLSHLKPRIMIHGDPRYLSNPEHQKQVRTLLLAGVRAARLWRQVGGSRWQIVFKNKQILLNAQRYLDRYGKE